VTKGRILMGEVCAMSATYGSEEENNAADKHNRLLLLDLVYSMTAIEREMLLRRLLIQGYLPV
jgi:hypothetical protein